MNDRELPVSEDELHAYVDGELPADRHAAVEAWLATHPEDMARVAAWRGQADTIRARYGSVADEPVPAHLALERLDRLDRSRRPWSRYAAAVVAALLVGGAIGWAARGAWAPAANPFHALTADALEAYRLYVVEVRHPVEVAGTDEAHLVQWLSKRVGYELRCPNLEKIGLKLVGGRLLPSGAAGAAAFFMYETTSGERFTLYSARSNTPETALRYNAAGSVAAMAWVDGDVAYVISGEANRDRLQAVAKAAYDQLEMRKPKQGT